MVLTAMLLRLFSFFFLLAIAKASFEQRCRAPPTIVGIVFRCVAKKSLPVKISGLGKTNCPYGTQGKANHGEGLCPNYALAMYPFFLKYLILVINILN